MTLSLAARDKKLIWHPLTQEKTAFPVIPIQKGEGAFLYDTDGKAYLDLISSWWVNLHGHSNPIIAKAIYEQAQNLEHVIFAGFTHEPGVTLCEELSNLLPPVLSRFFFSDNGSTAVEVSLKMAYQYWHQKKEPHRNLFLSFEGGYHGDTFGAMAVGSKSGFHNAFQNLLFKTLSIPFPSTWQNHEDIDTLESDILEELDILLKTHGNHIVAFMAEPLVQGASGMRMCRPEFLKKVILKVRAYGILVIFDEIMTGFFRTGKLFAFEHLLEGDDLSQKSPFIPDFLCVSKGITGGFLPLALTITTNTIYEAFLSDDWAHAFSHSHSYTANPLTCAAAVASLSLLKDFSCQESIRNMEETHKKGLRFLQKTIPDLTHKSRLRGTISAFDLKGNWHKEGLKKSLVDAGLLLRPLNHGHDICVYFMPPYVTKKRDLESAYEKISYILKNFSQV